MFPAVAEQHGSDNPYLNIFSSIDFTVICQVVMSLLALLFSYDAISREKESGTLRLALSGAVSRPTLLLGKYIAGMVSISLPLIASFVAGLLVTQFSPYVSFSGSDWGRILLIFLVSMLYVSLFFLIGLFLSTRTDRPSITLMFSMCVWVLFVLIVPNLTVLLVEHASPIQSEEAYKVQAREQWKQYEAEVKDYFEKRGVEGPLDRAQFGWCRFPLRFQTTMTVAKPLKRAVFEAKRGWLLPKNVMDLKKISVRNTPIGYGKYAKNISTEIRTDNLYWH